MRITESPTRVCIMDKKYLYGRVDRYIRKYKALGYQVESYRITTLCHEAKIPKDLVVVMTKTLTQTGLQATREYKSGDKLPG